MHEVSLGVTLRDYLTGEEIEETTYEEFRQALARLLVEEKGYPRERMRPKVDLCYRIDGEEICRPIDLVVSDPEGRPVLLVLFCAGDVGSFERESVFAARLFQGGPAPLALVTDTRSASLMDAGTGDVLAGGMRAIPSYEELLALARDRRMAPLTGEQREKAVRIFHAYSGFILGTCCNAECKLK